MITPNKFISFSESILSKLTYLLDFEEIISVSELYLRVEQHFDGLDEFLYALDTLYILNKIELDAERGLIKRC